MDLTIDELNNASDELTRKIYDANPDLTLREFSWNNASDELIRKIYDANPDLTLREFSWMIGKTVSEIKEILRG